MSTSLRITEAFPAPMPAPSRDTLTQQFRDAFAELVAAAEDVAQPIERALYCDGCVGHGCVRDSQLVFEHTQDCPLARLLTAVEAMNAILPHASSELLLCCRLGTHSQCEGHEEAVLPGGPTWRRECSCACHKEQA